MKAYAYIETIRFLVILSEEGEIVQKLEIKASTNKLKEICHKFAKNYDVEWIDKHWEDSRVSQAKDNYLKNYGVTYEGRDS